MSHQSDEVIDNIIAIIHAQENSTDATEEILLLLGEEGYDVSQPDQPYLSDDVVLDELAQYLNQAKVWGKNTTAHAADLLRATGRRVREAEGVRQSAETPKPSKPS